MVGFFCLLACWTRRPFWAEVCPDVRQFSVPWRNCVRTVRDFAGFLQALQVAASLSGKNAPRGHEGSLVEHSGSRIFYEPGGGLQLRNQPQTRLHHGIGRLQIPRGLRLAPRNGVVLARRGCPNRVKGAWHPVLERVLAWRDLAHVNAPVRLTRWVLDGLTWAQSAAWATGPRPGLRSCARQGAAGAIMDTSG